MINNHQNNRVQKILYLEDSPEDAELIIGFLNKNGQHFDITRISSLKDFNDELENNRPDIILSDFRLSGFDGFDALKDAVEKTPDIPFIFVTGAVGEEMAVKALKSGATDFILKNRLDRLLPAINRALDEHRTALERKKLYNTLKKSEERNRTLMENLPVGVFRTKVEQPGQILHANPAMAFIHGVESVDKLLEIKVEELYYNPGERKNFITEIVKKKNIKNKLIQFKKATGEPFWASVSAICHYDKNDTPDWIDGVVEDVSERLKTEEKLSIYLKFLEKLMDTINSPVFYKDCDGRYLGCNRKFAELIIGMPREHIINKTDFELTDKIPNELAILYDNRDRVLFANPGTQEYDARVKCADGSLRFYHFSKATYHDSEGNVAGLVGIMIDITARAESEVELKRINEEFEVLLASLPSLVIGVSTKDRITHWNAFADKIFGLRSETMIGRRFYEAEIDWNWTVIYEAIGDCVVNEKIIRVDNLNFQTYEGKKGILGLTINPLKRGGSELEGFMILGKDVTEQKILETQLLQSRKLEAIGQLAAGVAHEINTPLQYVGDNLKFVNKSFAAFLNVLNADETICANSADTEKLSELISRRGELVNKLKIPFLITEIPKALEQSLEGVDRVSKIVQSMKAFSHPGTGKKTLSNINRAIENTVTVSRNEWKYDTDIEFHLEPDLPEVPCFESELNQVILNLIVNAADAIHEAKEKKIIENGKIIIKTVNENSFAVIRIEDNGTGIPEGIRDRIFDLFFTTKDVGKGTGQGLAISHSIIVEKHGGILYFETETGMGTAFIIKLPLSLEG